MKQSIRLTKSADGVTIAWAEAGSGATLVKASNWLTHLEYDLVSPVWRHWIRFFADHFHVIRYDERGCGMSEWNVPDVSWPRWNDDLETIVSAAAPRKPFVLLGISQGGLPAIHYAATHPGDVSHLILYGVYAQGWSRRGDLDGERRFNALIELTRLGWGQNNPVYRQLFTSRFMPYASPEQFQWLNDLCRRTTTPQTAAALLEARMNVDITGFLPRISVPTLVLHVRNDEAVPISQGRLVASSIPGATFVELDSANHILLETEPAWERFKREVLAFAGQPAQARNDSPFGALTRRERDILDRIAKGHTNKEIGRQLFISEKTVRNYVTRILEKLGVRSRSQAIVLVKDQALSRPAVHRSGED